MAAGCSGRSPDTVPPRAGLLQEEQVWPALRQLLREHSTFLLAPGCWASSAQLFAQQVAPIVDRTGAMQAELLSGCALLASLRLSSMCERACHKSLSPQRCLAEDALMRIAQLLL